MDDAFYEKMLENQLVLEARKQYGNRWKFQQDNDLKHRGRIAMELLGLEGSDTID